MINCFETYVRVTSVLQMQCSENFPRSANSLKSGTVFPVRCLSAFSLSLQILDPGLWQSRDWIKVCCTEFHKNRNHSMTVCTVLWPGEITHIKPSGNNYVSFYWFLRRHIHPRSKNTEARCPGYQTRENLMPGVCFLVRSYGPSGGEWSQGLRPPLKQVWLTQPVSQEYCVQNPWNVTPGA